MGKTKLQAYGSCHMGLMVICSSPCRSGCIGCHASWWSPCGYDDHALTTMRFWQTSVDCHVDLSDHTMVTEFGEREMLDFSNLFFKILDFKRCVTITCGLMFD